LGVCQCAGCCCSGGRLRRSHEIRCTGLPLSWATT
jgi:hypothetical protein